ncbi:MAG: DNA-directed RNA polymerase subunit P [Candidatus Aenigmarchaeota archaeon]|nr:DNA-directed RNA polymerase subunit P [Candidatus Aenigmarchaeota archaeon]
MTYTCAKCREKVEKIDEIVICPHCGYRVLMKDRVSKVKKVIAR